MPEYSSPGVFVEEIDTGSKPIEVVSTSTDRMIGVTERGPVNVPLLITSYGEFTRWFGEKICRGPNFYGGHCYLPHTVEGFFVNGGKRTYITRIESEAAVRSQLDLHNRGDNNSAYTRLLRATAEDNGTGTGANDSACVRFEHEQRDPVDRCLICRRSYPIGNDSNSEYRGADFSVTNLHLPLALPLNRPHPETTAVENVAREAGPSCLPATTCR